MRKIIRNNILLVLIIMLCRNLLAYPGKILKSFPLPGKFSTGLAFDGNHLWVADYKEDIIYKIDPASGAVMHQIPSPGFWPMGLAWDGQYLWNVDRKQIFI